MTADSVLRDKLRKIEALFSGATTPGEKAAAGAAADRIRRHLKDTGSREPDVEYKFSLADPWSRRLCVALCRRYGLRPFRYPRQKRQTIVVKAPRSFIEQTLWPEFQQLNEALVAYLVEITDKVIREELHGETGEAEEVPEPRSLPG